MKNENFKSLLIITVSIAIVILGFQFIYYKSFNPALFPFKKNLFTCSPLAIFVGLILMISGAASFIRSYRRWAYLLISILLLLSILFAHIPAIIENIKNANEWTGAFETIAIFSTTMIIAQLSTADNFAILSPISTIRFWQYTFASSLFVFGALHFLYGGFISLLIPSWIPFRLFWAYFVGVAFIAAAISLISKVKMELAMGMMGSMFIIWVLIVHAPRVFIRWLDRDEWSSLLIALILSCTGFLIMNMVAQRSFKPTLKNI